MKDQPLRTTVIGSYPFPSWLEFASQKLEKFGTNEFTELQDDAVIIAIHDQMEAGLDVITDGEQSRLDFNYRSMDIYRASSRMRSRCVCLVRRRTTSAANIILWVSLPPRAD